MTTPLPEKQLAGFIAKFTPEIAALIREARKKMRERLPQAVELVDDNYNCLCGYPKASVNSVPLWPPKKPLCSLCLCGKFRAQRPLCG
jgi:hypothetical protein